VFHVSYSRVKGREKIHRFRFGEISRKLGSIEKGVEREIERYRNRGEEECYTYCVEECGKSREKGRGKGNGETCRNTGGEVCCTCRVEGLARLVERSVGRVVAQAF